MRERAGREAGTEGSHGGGHNIPRGNRLRDEGIARRLLQYLQKKKRKRKKIKYSVIYSPSRLFVVFFFFFNAA